MENINKSLAHTWPFERVIDCLKMNEQVQGLLLVGSLAQDALTSASDFDLVIILRDAPQPWYVGVTTIEGRFSDLIFVAASTLDEVVALNEPIPSGHALAPILRWLKNGKSLFDRRGQIQRCQDLAHSREWVLPLDDEEIFSSWFAINYNLAVAQRMSASPDPLYQATAGIRMAVYGYTNIWLGYFTLRKLPWEGDKAGVRYLQQNDMVFFETYQRFIGAVDLEEKLRLYRQAAELAAAPLGGLWPPGSTVTNVAQASGTWEDLISMK
jgi:hypothetical protein